MKLEKIEIGAEEAMGLCRPKPNHSECQELYSQRNKS